MHNKTIYTFWEPRGSISAYLNLCMKTWEPHICGIDHVILDYSNLFEFIPKDSIDINKIKHLSLAVQKDAFQAAVLKYNGGVFLDADMILVNDINPLFQYLDKFQVVTFSSHLAFMMAKPNSPFLNDWYDEVLKKIEALPTNHTDVEWDYFGNQIVNEKFKNRIYNTCQLDKHVYGFTPEVNYFFNYGDVMKMYGEFWFSRFIDTEEVFFEKQSIIALHNSWTPERYRNLAESEILAHPSLLSRTLALILNHGKRAKPKKVTIKMRASIKLNWFIKAIIKRFGFLL